MPASPRPLLLATLNFLPKKGGVEQLCAELARELAELGVPLHVVAPRVPGSAAFDASAPYAITRYAEGPLRDVHLARAVARLVDAGHDRVLFAQWTAVTLTLLRRRFTGQPQVLVSLGHGKEFLIAEAGYRSTRVFGNYRRAVLSRLGAVLAVSDYTAGKARLAGARDVHVMHPGVNSQRFAPLEARPTGGIGADRAGPILLTVARLVPRKGIDTLLRALPALLRQQPKLRCVVAGDGPDAPRLHQLAQTLGVSEHVDFLGEVPDAELPALYAAADLFLLLSREDPSTGDVEGFGLVLLEAQAAGTPVIASRTGGMPDALLPDETGLLVDADDAVGLARELDALLGDAQRLRALTQAARRYAESQTWRATAQRALAIIDACSAAVPVSRAAEGPPG